MDKKGKISKNGEIDLKCKVSKVYKTSKILR